MKNTDMNIPKKIEDAIMASSWGRSRSLLDAIQCIQCDVEDYGQRGLPEGLTMADLAIAVAARDAAIAAASAPAPAPAPKSAADRLLEELLAEEEQKKAAAAAAAERAEALDRLYRLVSGSRIGAYFHDRGIRPAAGRDDHRREDWRADYELAPELASLTTEQVGLLCDHLATADLSGSGYGSQSLPQIALALFAEPEPTPEPELRNLTPHRLTIHRPAGDLVTLDPSGIVPRVEVTRQPAGEIGGIALHRSLTGSVTGLPDAEPGVVLIVSALVRLALPARTDLASPGQLIRDNNGQPVGCDGLYIN